MEQHLQELRDNLSGLSLGQLSHLVEQQTEAPSQDPNHAIGMILMWAFAHNTHDDAEIASGLGIPVSLVFMVTANCIKSRIWEKQLNIDDGITFGLMISAAQGQLEYFPEGETWKMTEKGKKYVEEKILTTPAGADLMKKLNKADKKSKH